VVRLAYVRAAVVVLAVLGFARSLDGGFVYDDHAIVKGDPRVQRGDLVGALTRPYWHDRPGGLYRPVVTLSYVVQGHFSREPFAFRLVNLILHAGASLMAFELGWRILARAGPGGERPAFLAAAIFAAHPAHVEVAANVVGRAESLGFVLAAGAWWATRGGRLGLATVLATTAVLAKENALAVVLAAPLELLVFGPRRPSGLARALAPAVVAAGCAVLLRTLVLGSQGLTPAAAGVAPYMNPLIREPLLVRLANAPIVLGHYVRTFVVPMSLSPDYGGEAIPLARGLDGRAVAGLLGTAVALLFPILVLRRTRAVAFGILFYLLALGPVLQVVPIGTLAADRLSYAASFGLALVAGQALSTLERATRARGAVALLAGILVGGLVASSASYARDWTEDLRLFETAARRSTGSVQLQLNLGKVLILRGDYARAVDPLRRAAQLVPTEPSPLILLARAERLSGRPAPARPARE
jgi:hypothetical protein